MLTSHFQKVLFDTADAKMCVNIIKHTSKKLNMCVFFFKILYTYQKVFLYIVHDKSKIKNMKKIFCKKFKIN